MDRETENFFEQFPELKGRPAEEVLRILEMEKRGMLESEKME